MGVISTIIFPLRGNCQLPNCKQSSSFEFDNRTLKIIWDLDIVIWVLSIAVWVLPTVPPE
jgi:hypothetical protein